MPPFGRLRMAEGVLAGLDPESLAIHSPYEGVRGWIGSDVDAG